MAVIPCGTPENLTITYDAGASSALVSWDAMPSANGFNVRARKDANPEAELYSSLGTNSFTITDLEEGQSIVIYVRTICGGIDEDPAVVTYPAIAAFTVPIAGAAAPTNFHFVEMKRTTVKLAWDGAPGRYVVSYYTQVGAEGPVTRLEVTDNSNEISIEALDPYNDYYFYVSYLPGAESFTAENYLDKPKTGPNNTEI